MSPKNLFLLILFSFFSLSGFNQCIAMTFEVQERCVNGIQPPCQQIILGFGYLDRDAVTAFKSVAHNMPKGSWVALSSPGGNLLGGLQLGMAIRELGMNTTIGSTDYSPLECFSACAYAFLGGQYRHIPDGGRYGLHQFKGLTKEISEAESKKIRAILLQFLDMMGADRRLLDFAVLTSTERMSVLSPAQAKLLGVDNFERSTIKR